MIAPLARVLGDRGIRYVMIGVGGANVWAHPGVAFSTEDHDLFLPPDPPNLLATWQACEEVGFALECDGDPLDRPRDLWLAERVVASRALTRATGGEDWKVDLTLVMASFRFDEVWESRREFVFDGVSIPVARLSHIVRSKAAVGRKKDLWFLDAHAEELRGMLSEDEREGLEAYRERPRDDTRDDPEG